MFLSDPLKEFGQVEGGCGFQSPRPRLSGQITVWLLPSKVGQSDSALGVSDCPTVYVGVAGTDVPDGILRISVRTI